MDRRIDQEGPWGAVFNARRYYWIPPSGAYVAIGYYDYNIDEYVHAAGCRRDLVVRRGSIQFAEHEYEYDGGMGASAYHWRHRPVSKPPERAARKFSVQGWPHLPAVLHRAPQSRPLRQLWMKQWSRLTRQP